MPKQSRTKRVARVHASRNALYLLLAFCGGLMLPVFIVWINIMIHTPKALIEPERPIEVIPDSALDLQKPELHLRFDGRDLIGSDILIADTSDDIGWFMTTEFANLLQKNPTCETFLNSGYSLPQYFSNIDTCLIAGNEHLILIGNIGMTGVYEGLPVISDSILAISDESPPKLFYGIHQSLSDQSVILSPLLDKYPNADFGNNDWIKLANEYEVALKARMSNTDELKLAQQDLFRIMLAALRVDPEKDLPNVFTFMGQSPSYYFTDSQGNISKMYAENGLWNGNGKDNFSHDDHYISPNEKWIVLKAGFGEISGLALYNTQTQETPYFEGLSGSSWEGISWLPDNRLQIKTAWCMEGSLGADDFNVVNCGSFESISAERPWIMKKTSL